MTQLIVSIFYSLINAHEFSFHSYWCHHPLSFSRHFLPRHRVSSLCRHLLRTRRLDNSEKNQQLSLSTFLSIRCSLVSHCVIVGRNGFSVSLESGRQMLRRREAGMEARFIRRSIIIGDRWKDVWDNKWTIAHKIQGKDQVRLILIRVFKRKEWDPCGRVVFYYKWKQSNDTRTRAKWKKEEEESAHER